tara:strand:- start:955 stop:1359 length:405 start_codon:yes stop_codon:yes gene_type:complete
MNGVGTGPINGNMKAGTTCSGAGLLLKTDGTNTLNVVSAVGNTPLGVSFAHSHKDKDGALVAGGRVSLHPSGGVLYIQSQAVTWVQGSTCYAHTDGTITNVDGGSATVIGVYVGQGETATAGALVAVNTNNAGW